MEERKPNSNRIARNYVMAELMKRGYILKNAEGGFIIARSPSGKVFRIKVHGQRRHNPWILTESSTKVIEPADDLFYALAFVPRSDVPKFNVWTSHSLAREATKISDEDKTRGAETWYYGIRWETAFKGLDRWKLLPE